VKKNNQDINLFNSDISSDKYLDQDKIKTTNVNILLNRVRLDKKRVLRKKIVFSFILLSLVVLLAVYFNN
tara:strand:+ start:1431 stop:1640 length:210 start_codon:yes stop_codon:yes gene_type:complete